MYVLDSVIEAIVTLAKLSTQPNYDGLMGLIAQMVRMCVNESLFLFEIYQFQKNRSTKFFGLNENRWPIMCMCVCVLVLLIP